MRGSYPAAQFGALNGKEVAQVLADGIKGKSGLPLALDPRVGHVIFDDFLSSSTTGNAGFGTNTTGTSSGASILQSPSGTSGIIATGASGSTSNGAIFMSSFALNAAASTFYCEMRFRPVSVYSATEREVIYLGLMNSIIYGAPANGVYWSYDVNSYGQFLAKTTVASSTATTEILDGGGGRDSAPCSNADYVRVGFIYEAGVRVDWFFNGQSIGTASTTNLPSGNVALCAKLDKVNGTDTRNVAVDYIYMAQVFDSER